MQLKCRAKINLAIDVLGKREDNYHLVKMIMQTIDLCDYINIEEINTDAIIIESDNPHVPTDFSNIVYKAAKLIKNKFNITKGIKIRIQKNIPIAAGMAGGSSNGAAVLVGLNKLWNLNLKSEQLMDLGLALGADVPFCISGGAAVAQGIGEKLTSIKGLNDVYILICKPNFDVSTAMVYKELDMNKVSKRPDINMLVEYLKNEKIEEISINMANVLESVTENKYPEIYSIKKTMNEYGALGSMMSGSGPTVFGIFKDFKKANFAMEKLKVSYSQTYLVKSHERGIEIEG